MSKIFWGLFLILTFLITLPASWLILTKVDFGYDFLHDNIGISDHITKYAPRNNKNKKDFELTTKSERIALFHGIVESIQNQGKGLVQLDYKNRHQQEIGLLTVAEIIHLRDVANLLDKLKPLAWIAILSWLAILVILRFRRVKLPSTKQLSFNTLFIIVIFTGILLLGPERIFNQLHIWVFPNNHQWFFYYEESLMSTMMKAPDLFAYIAGFWTLLSVFLSMALLKLLRIAL